MTKRSQSSIDDKTMSFSQLDGARFSLRREVTPEPQEPITRTVEDGLVYYRSAEGQCVILNERQDAELRDAAQYVGFCRDLTLALIKDHGEWTAFREETLARYQSIPTP